MTNCRWVVLFALLTIGAMEGISACSASELLVSDRASHRVVVYDADTGAYRRELVAPDLANMYSPSAMAIGFGGDLFVADQASGKITRYNSVNGSPKGTTPGSPVFLDFGFGSGPAGMLYDATNSRLFVAFAGNDFTSTTIKIFNGSGSEIGMLNAGPAGGRTGMVLDSTGNLYVNNFATNGFYSDSGAILKFSGTNFGTMDTVITGEGESTPYLSGLNGLTIDNDGNLYTANLFGQQVNKLQTNGSGFQVISAQNPPNPSNPPTAYPSGLLIKDGTLLVSTLGNNTNLDPYYGHLPPFSGSVQKFDLNGNYLGSLVPYGPLGPSGDFQPTSMVLVPDPIPGDFDGDRDVDGADFAAWQGNFPVANGGTLAGGDADGDGDIDGADFIVWQTNYPTSSSEPIATPEPAACLLAFLGVAGIVAVRRKSLA